MTDHHGVDRRTISSAYTAPHAFPEQEYDHPRQTTSQTQHRSHHQNGDHFQQKARHGENGTWQPQIGSRWQMRTTSVFESWTSDARGLIARWSSFPDKQMSQVPQISPDEAIQWFHPFSMWFYYFMCQIGVSILYSFLYSETMIQFPGHSILNAFVRAIAIGMGTLAIVLIFVRRIGAINDIYHLLNILFSDVCFSKKWDDLPNPWLERFSVLLKLLICFMGIVVGNFVGPLFSVLIRGGSVTTSDCAVEYVTLCLALPATTTTTIKSSQTMSVFVHLVYQCAIFVAWKMIKTKSLLVRMHNGLSVPAHALLDPTEGESIDLEADNSGNQNPDSEGFTKVKIDEGSYLPVGLVQGGAAFLCILFTSSFIGVGFDTFFWVAISVYTGDRTQANVYAWTGLMAALICFGITAFDHSMIGIAIREKAKVFLEFQRKQSA